MKNTILNTDKRTFLISFQHRSTDSKFLFQEPKDLKYILETFDYTGIESIKEFDPHKNTFKRVSKETIVKFAAWETEVILFLENHYYFKK